MVVITSPWNYPLQLRLSPLISALAAGNRVVSKPSEISSAVEQLVAELAPRYVDREAVPVVTGRADAATARRITRGKFSNAGQTCAAPDHIYAHQDVAAALAEELATAGRESFGARPEESEDFGRMIHTGAADRVGAMISPVGSDNDICGGQVDRKDRYVASTVLYPMAEVPSGGVSIGIPVAHVGAPTCPSAVRAPAAGGNITASGHEIRSPTSARCSPNH